MYILSWLLFLHASLPAHDPITDLL
jgi:hypothetical protein